MSERLARLASRRASLVARSAVQRQALAEDVAPWRRSLNVADRGLAVLRLVRNHPAWIVGSVVMPVALRPGRVGKWVRRGLAAWQIVHRLRRRPASA